MKDYKNACKFNCATNIDKVAHEKIFHDFYKLYTDGKHSFINQISLASLNASYPTPQKRQILLVFFRQCHELQVCKKF